MDKLLIWLDRSDKKIAVFRMVIGVLQIIGVVAAAGGAWVYYLRYGTMYPENRK